VSGGPARRGAVAAALVAAALVGISLVAGCTVAMGAETVRAADGEVVARAFEVRFRPLKDAADLIGSVLSADGSVTLQPRLRTVVVQDHASVLERVATLLQSFDLPPRNVEVTLSLFLGTDRREEEAGRQARPGGPAREVRGVTEILGDVTKWNSYQLLGGRSVVGAEGAPMTVNLTDDYRVTFEVASVGGAQGTIALRGVTLGRVIRAADGGEQIQNLYSTSINIASGKLVLLGAAKSPDSKKALFLSLQARPR
jgi:hypothetical protein